MNITTSILILTHNAPKYVKETIVSLNEITPKEERDCCEIVVVDNASDTETKDLLNELKSIGYIDSLYFSAINTYFAGGNNLAASLASNNSQYYLLLNSDVRIISKDWLNNLYHEIRNKKTGAVGYGLCRNPSRADGYCFLVKKSLFVKHKMDESFQWWWSMTLLEAKIMKDGYDIVVIPHHEDVIHHYGGASGNDFLDAVGMNTQKSEVRKWFCDTKGHVVVRLYNFRDFYLEIKSITKYYKSILKLGINKITHSFNK